MVGGKGEIDYGVPFLLYLYARKPLVLIGIIANGFGVILFGLVAID